MLMVMTMLAVVFFEGLSNLLTSLLLLLTLSRQLLLGCLTCNELFHDFLLHV